MNINKRSKAKGAAEGSSLIELLSAVSVLLVLMLILMGALVSVSNLFVGSEKKVQALDGGRSSLELITRELAPAVVDTRMQFVVIPGETLQKSGAPNVAAGSHAALWMAPLGKNGDLRCAGYYLTRNEELNLYRLTRIYIREDNPHGYFPTIVNGETGGKSLEMRTDALSADWFTSNWNAEAFDEEGVDISKLIVSTVSVPCDVL